MIICNPSTNKWHFGLFGEIPTMVSTVCVQPRKVIWFFPMSIAGGMPISSVSASVEIRLLNIVLIFVTLIATGQQPFIMFCHRG